MLLIQLSCTLALLCVGALLVLVTADLLKSDFVFWPPPAPDAWQNTLFRLLFRGLVYGSIIASAAHIWHFGLGQSRPRMIGAMVLFLAGFVIAFLGTGMLGWRRAFGDQGVLKTTGIFAYSRNPIYVATFFGLLGWALLIPVPLLVITLACWALLYVLAIRLEERWLLKLHGKRFSDYCQTVRRYF